MYDGLTSRYSGILAALTCFGKPFVAAPRTLISFCGTCLLACMLSGCLGGGGDAVRYYLIDPVDSAADAGKPARALAIEITDLDIPQYLERFQIVTRDGNNRLHLSENNQWGENLRKNLMRTLSRNLAERLRTIDISTPFNRSASMPDYRVQVYISSFERSVDGVVRLSGRWQISNRSEQVLGMRSSDLDSGSKVGEHDYAAIVAAMQDLYAQFCTKIADSIIAEEK